MPQPIDIQTELGRATLVERVAEIQGRLSVAAHQRAHTESIEARSAAETTVNQPPQVENREIEADGRRRNPFVGRRKKKSATQDEDPEKASTFYTAAEQREVVDDPGAHKLDISV